MKNISILASIILIISIYSCTKDREFAADVIIPIDSSGQIGLSTLLINEFQATGSTLPNPDFPALNGSDWIELYNPSDDTVFIDAGKWSIADSVLPGQSDASILMKDTFVLPKKYMLIQCDSQDTVFTQFHTAFNLSKDGEAIGLFYDGPDSIIVIDSIRFGVQLSGTSQGRKPDGTTNWAKPLTPSPGAPN